MNDLTYGLVALQALAMTNWTDSLNFIAPISKKEPHPKGPQSPYFEQAREAWREITGRKLAMQPLDGPTLAKAVLDSWDDIFSSKIGPAQIGKEILPTPQIMGFLLHELIPLRISKLSHHWRRDASSTEKDLVYVPDADFSIEIKTSSHKNQIFGNRSFGVESATPSKKAKSGYYCTVNFQKWDDVTSGRPEITLVRYGWIDQSDWVSQAAQTGQNSSLPRSVYDKQLAVIFSRP